MSYNISNAALNDLLTNVLQSHKCFNKILPKDAKTLLKTSVSCKNKIPLIVVDPGYYYHFGISSGINRYYQFDKINNSNNDIIKLVLEIDVLPLSKISNNSFWPILCYIRPHNDLIFPIGIYWGNEKPRDSNNF